jgi:hypothetical protein
MDLPISFRAEIAVVKTFSSIIRNSHLRAQIAHPLRGSRTGVGHELPRALGRV